MSNSHTSSKVYSLIFRFLYENILLFITSQGYEERFNLMKLNIKRKEFDKINTRK